MSVRAIAFHNLKKRKFFLQMEQNKKVFKALSSDITLKKSSHIELYKSYHSKFPKNAHLTRSSNKCLFTGRSKGNLSLFKMSRLQLKVFANNGVLPGLKKSSW